MPIYPDPRGRKTHRLVRVHWKGRPHSRIIRGNDEAARIAEANLLLELERDEAQNSRARLVAPTFSAFCVSRYKPHAERELAPQTWKNRQYQLATFIEHFGALRLTEFTTEKIETFLDERAKSVGPSKLNDDRAKLLTILNYARYLKIPVSVPEVRRRKERPTRGRVKVWDRRQVAALYRTIQAKHPEILGIVVFLLNTGCRKGEAIAAERAWVDGEAGLLCIEPNEFWRPKNGEPREVPIGDALRPWLEAASHPFYIFQSQRGGRFVRFPDHQFRECVKAATVNGRPIGGSPHVCRHTYASHFLKKVPDLFLLSKVLGHSHEKVTKLYAHLLPDHLAKARNAVSFSPGVTPTEAAAIAKWHRAEPRTKADGTKAKQGGAPSKAARRQLETEVRTLLADGAKTCDIYDAIADRFRVSTRTVDKYIRRAKAELELARADQERAK